MLTALLAITKAQKMAHIVGCAPTSLFEGGDVGCRNILSRLKVLIITFFVGSAVFGGVDCEAYKTQVLNDCNAAINTVRMIDNELNYISHEAAIGANSSSNTTNSSYYNTFIAIKEYADNSLGRVQTLEDNILSIQQTARELQCTTSDGSCDCADVLGDISAQLSTINNNLVAQGSKIDTINTRLNSIITITTTVRDKLVNVDSNVGNMSTVLTDIKGYLESQAEVLQSIFGDSYDKGIQGILANAEATTDWLDDIYTLLQSFEELISDIAAQLYQICDYFDNYLQEAFPLWLELLRVVDPEKVSSALDNLSNNMGLGNFLDLFTNQYFSTWLKLTSTKLNRPITSVGSINAQYVQSLFNPSTKNYGFVFGNIWPTRPFIPSFENMLLLYADTIPRTLASISTIEYLRYLNENTNSVNSILTDFTNQVAQGFASLTNLTSYSIKPYIDALDKSPLDGQTGDFFVYLTNDYLSAFSGTNPNTNYFRRVEVLLAAMLFRDNQDSDRISKLEKDIDKVKGDKESLVDAVKPDELVGNYNLGLSMFDDMPTLPTIGAGGLPDTITIEIPKWTGWKETVSGSGSENLTIELKTEKFKGFFDFLHNFFVFVYYGVVLFFVWVAFRCLMRGVVFAYNSVQKLTIK